MAVVGAIDMSKFIDALASLPKRISAEARIKASHAGGEVFRSAIEANTPSGGSYTYQRNGKTVTFKDPHPGQARSNVIIYNRKQGRTEYYVDATNVLVGYEKRKGYYMYWREMGSSKQAAKPVVRPVFDSMSGEALAAIESSIRETMEEVLQGMAV